MPQRLSKAALDTVKFQRGSLSLFPLYQRLELPAADDKSPILPH